MEQILVPMPKSLVEMIDEKRGDLDREAFMQICINHTLANENQEPPWKNTFDRLWIIAFASYGVGDSVASYIALHRAGIVGDPLLHLLFRNNFYPVIPFKIVVLIVALLISNLLLEDRLSAFFFPVILSIAGIIFIFYNISYIIGF